MSLYKISDCLSGRDFGLFSAQSEADALDMFARAHGCRSYRQSVFCTAFYRGEIRVEDISNRATRPQPQDSPGLVRTLSKLLPVRFRTARAPRAKIT